MSTVWRDIMTKKIHNKLNLKHTEKISLSNSSLTEHHRRGSSRKRASPFHLPGHVLVNGYYYTSTTYVPQQKGSFVFKGGRAGRNRVREATDRSNEETRDIERQREKESERGWRHESVERGELNGAETNLKTLAARRERRKRAWVALRSAYGIGETAHVHFLNSDMPIISSRAWLHGIFIIFLNFHWIKDGHFFFNQRSNFQWAKKDILWLIFQQNTYRRRLK